MNPHSNFHWHANEQENNHDRLSKWKIPPQSSTNSPNIHLDPANVHMAINGNRADGPRIKRSTIPDVGFGLFADKYYKRNSLITVYGGSLHFNDVVEGEYVLSLQESPPICVDGKDNFHPSEKGRWLNHGYTLDNIPRIRHLFDSDVKELSTDNKSGTKKPYLFQNSANTEYYVTRKNNFPICYIRAIRDIEKGEELFVDYGDQYWI
jgi:hypothetical protein